MWSHRDRRHRTPVKNILTERQISLEGDLKELVCGRKCVHQALASPFQNHRSGNLMKTDWSHQPFLVTYVKSTTSKAGCKDIFDNNHRSLTIATMTLS